MAADRRAAGLQPQVRGIQPLARSSDDRALAASVGITRTRATALPAAGYATGRCISTATGLCIAGMQALADSPHPGVLDARLAMKSDPTTRSA